VDEYKLPRWSIYIVKEGCLRDPMKYGYVEDQRNDESGEWVKWDDVKPLLQAYLILIDKNNKKKDLSITEIKSFV